MESFKFKFEKHPAKKGICPKCEYKNVFRYYQDMPREFGRCERINKCGYHNKPNGNQLTVNHVASIVEVAPTIIYPDDEYCKSLIENSSSNFHKFCLEKLNIPQTHLQKWLVGSEERYPNDVITTVFILADRTEKYINAKYIDYQATEYRSKDSVPHYIKAKRKGTKYAVCLYGEHLLNDDKPICLVESEKTAVIARFFYSELDWLATGGGNGLTDEKLKPLNGRKVFYLPDADKAGRENSTIRKLKSNEIDFELCDLYHDRDDGYDLADAIIDGKHPEIITTNSNSPSDSDDGPRIKEKSTRRPPQIKIVEEYLLSKYELRYNVVDNELEIRNNDTVENFKRLNENNLFCELQRNFIRFSQTNLHALLQSDFVAHYNPFQYYFESLPKWTEQENLDYIAKLSQYIQTADDADRFKIQFSKMLVRTIACALDERVVNKHAFILVGQKQHTGKTTFLQWLCPPALDKYYTETFIKGKDGEMALSDNLIINFDEMSGLTRIEVNSIKSSISRLFVRQRRPFAKSFSNFPRRASFVGSTNDPEFLVDVTGNVRWLCFEITGIDFKYSIEVNIDNIWSQAYSLYKAGFIYKLTKDEIEENERANSKHFMDTIEINLIQKYFLPGTKDQHDFFGTATGILSQLSKVEPDLKNQININKIGKALTYLGFQRGQMIIEKDAYQTKGYFIRRNTTT